LLLLIAGNVRTLLDFLEEVSERGLEAESLDDREYEPHKRSNCKEHKDCLPNIGLEVEGVVKRARAESGEECDEQGCGRNPSGAGLDASEVLAEAEFESVLGNDDYVLCKVKVNARLLDVIRRKGLGEFAFGRNGRFVHCELLSGGGSPFGGGGGGVPLNKPIAPRA
jgi:hypothetical protein